MRLVFDVIVDLVDDAGRNLLCDAGALDLHPHADLPAAVNGGFRSRDGLGDAHVVDGALLPEPRDGRVDVVGWVILSCQPLAHLRFGQLAAREHFQSVDVRVAHIARRESLG